MSINTNILTPEITLQHYNEWLKIDSQPKLKMAVIPRSKTGGKALKKSASERETSGLAKEAHNESQPKTKRPPDAARNQHYAKKYQTAYEKELMSQLRDTDSDLDEGTLHQLEDDTLYAGSVNNIQDLRSLNPDAYKGFTFSNTTCILPVEEQKEKILNTIESNQVTVIQGPTGSGKTTHVPQIILDYYASRNQYCNIVVTQPRRIAAISIAKRVCQERRWQMGTFCGYQVGMDRQVNPNTCLTYVTTGVLLQKLINLKEMNNYTHVILDEIHERDQDTDFCILVVRKLLRSNSRGVRVVLMSATLDVDRFANYFAQPLGEVFEPAPVISVDGSIFSVSEYYIEDLSQLGPLPNLDPENPHITEEAQNLAIKLIQHFDKLESKEQGDKYFDPAVHGTVLIFLPGLVDIDNLYDKLRELSIRHRLFVIPLHSSVTIEEQNRVFQPTPEGHRKVILSTNIAESSITVSDIKYVIDFCLTKNLLCDSQTNFTSLQVEWASKANCIQRKGRSGRVCNGRVYRLITRHFWDNYIPDYSTPEMQRCPLDLLVLQTKILDLGEPKAVLALALSPPNLEEIERTILNLKEIGAICMPLDGIHKRYDGDLTYLGRVIAALPVDVKVGKLLVLGHVFGFLKECLILGAALSLRSIISRPYKKYLESYQRKFGWADGSFSDCIAIVNVYKAWESNWSRGIFKRRGQSEAEWGKSNFIQIKRIREVADLIRELECRLAKFNIRIPKESPSSKKELNDPEEKLLFKLTICGAFYPNYFVKDSVDECEAMKILSGKDPYNTAMVSGIPANQGSLYKPQIERIFSICGNVLALHMEETKIFIEFARQHNLNRDHYDQPIGMGETGKVNPAVYLALKMRQSCRQQLELQQYTRKETNRLMKMVQKVQSDSTEQLQKLRTNRITASTSNCTGQVRLPSLNESVILITVSDVVECGHFWARYVENEDDLYFVQVTLNHNELIMLKDPHKGMMCAAPYQCGEVAYYRAIIEQIVDKVVYVFFVDFGNVDKVNIHSLRQLPSSLKTIPFLAFECFLKGMKPSPIKCSDGCWSSEANSQFKKMVSERNLHAEVYSVVGNVLHVDLVKQTDSGSQVNFNRVLLNLGFADVAEETILSKKNHEERERAKMVAPNFGPEELSSLDWKKLGFMQELENAQKSGMIKLHGPSNPLEMAFAGMTNTGRFRSAKIDPDSVNCISIDENPQDPSSRMMVAAFVHMSSNGLNLVARDTTLLPHIPGLPALITMLFTPYCEFRVNLNKTRYTGMICGLGHDEDTGCPIYPEHDIEIEFDAHIGYEDIMKVNAVRLAINIVIGSQTSASSWGPNSIVSLQNTARLKLLDLMKTRRERVEPYPAWQPYEWNLLSPSDYLKPDYVDKTWDLVHNLHHCVALVPEDEDDDSSVASASSSHNENLIKHAEELRRISLLSSYDKVIHCHLCNETFPTPQILNVHVFTNRHIKNEEKLINRH